MGNEGVERHIKGFRSAHIREQIGGVKASTSYLAVKSFLALQSLGWSDDRIVTAFNGELAKLRGGNND